MPKADAPKRSWIYPELKFITVHQDDYSIEQLTKMVNEKFHSGADVRTEADVEKIKRGKTIFNKPLKDKRGLKQRPNYL